MDGSQDWCYSSYEIPPRGVSSDNPAGHLLMALRNRGERRSLNEAFTRLQSTTGVFRIADQSLLLGVLSMLPWQLIFVPCVNPAEVEGSKTTLVRHTLMQALRPTQPDFQQPWASGMPGTIALAKVDYILAVDRHSRVYKFDPITNRWSATMDGVKRAVSSLLHNSSADVPHTPQRLLIFTTDFEVYGFRLFTPNMVASSNEDYRMVSGERQSKQFVKSFVKSLTSRVAHVRSSTGLDLAVEYSEDSAAHLPSTAPTSPQYSSLYSLPKSINPFKLPDDSWITYQRYRPINRNPVHPVHRLHQDWASFKPDTFVWIENTDFSFCRTYPLKVPSVPMKRAIDSMQLIGARACFAGHRFPMLSYVHTTKLARSDDKAPTNVWLLRSGSVAHPLDLQKIFNCDNSPPTPPKCLVHIQLTETSSFKDISSPPMDSIHTNFVNLQRRMESDVLHQNVSFHNVFESPPQWFVPVLKDLSRNSSPKPNKTQSRPCLLPPHLEFLTPCEDVSAAISWPTPLAKVVEQAWLKLGSLARLPQIHIPPGEKASSVIPGSMQNLTSHKSHASLNSLNDLERSSGLEPSPVLFPNALTLTPNMIRRTNSTNRLSVSSMRNSRFSSVFLTDSDDKAPFLSLAGNFKPGVPLQRKISTLAAECSPHRSSWNEQFNTTRWFNLIAVCLDQATRLAAYILHLASCFHVPNSGYYVFLSGPGTGRTWQSIITSLTQLILSPKTRTLSGFEDLIEREWVRAGYPFAPDPSYWHDHSVPKADYDGGASFALFMDCVHQLLFQFPVDFEFTEDYLVVLLDTVLSRGGGLPPFAIEFSCSCDAARCISGKHKSSKQVAQQSDILHRRAALRCFRDWSNVLTRRGLELLPNWRYWWYWHPNPIEIKNTDSRALLASFSPSFQTMPQLFPVSSPASYIRCWVHGWFRWNRSLRLATGGGYAFDAAFCRSLLGPSEPDDEGQTQTSLDRTRTSASPYTGWMSDEAIEIAESLYDDDLLAVLESDSLAPLLRLVSDWELLPDLASQP